MYMLYIHMCICIYVCIYASQIKYTHIYTLYVCCNTGMCSVRCINWKLYTPTRAQVHVKVCCCCWYVCVCVAKCAKRVQELYMFVCVREVYSSVYNICIMYTSVCVCVYVSVECKTAEYFVLLIWMRECLQLVSGTHYTNIFSHIYLQLDIYVYTRLVYINMK